MVNQQDPLLTKTLVNGQLDTSTTSLTTSSKTKTDRSELNNLDNHRININNLRQAENNLQFLHDTNFDASSQYFQMLQSTPHFLTTFSTNSQTQEETPSLVKKDTSGLETYLEHEINSFQLPQPQNNFSYNFTPLELSQFQLPNQYELDNSHSYLQDCLTPNFSTTSARPPPPTPDSPFLLTNSYLEISGLTPINFDLPLTPSSRSSPFGMKLVPSETLLPPSAFPEPDGIKPGTSLKLSCTSLTELPKETLSKPTKAVETIFSHQSLSTTSTTPAAGVQGLATASSLLCLDKELASYTPSVKNQIKSLKEITSLKVISCAPIGLDTLSSNKAVQVIPLSDSAASLSSNPTAVCTSSATASAAPAVMSPPPVASQAKRFKKSSSIRKLLPLPPSVKSTTLEKETESPVCSTSLNSSSLLSPFACKAASTVVSTAASTVASPLSLIPQNSFTAQLTSKSNYQLLREGRTTELGLDFGSEATESLFRKRQAHKDAERVRRRNQVDQLHALRQVLSHLPTSASKMAVISEARETLVHYDNLIKQQSDLIRTLLSKLCPEGDLPSDLPQILSGYRSDTFDPTKK